MFSLKTYQKLWTVLLLTWFVIISVHNNLYTLRTWSCSTGTRVKDQDFILYEMQSLIDDFLWFLHLILYFSAWTESNSKQQTSNYIPYNTYLTRPSCHHYRLKSEKEVTGKNMLNFFLFFFSHKGKAYHSALIWAFILCKWKHFKKQKAIDTFSSFLMIANAALTLNIKYLHLWLLAYGKRVI